MSTATTTSGRIIQVIGSTFDAEFPEGHMPDIYNALKVSTETHGIRLNLTGEVQQHWVAAACGASPWVRPTVWPAAWKWSTPVPR